MESGRARTLGCALASEADEGGAEVRRVRRIPHVRKTGPAGPPKVGGIDKVKVGI